MQKNNTLVLVILVIVTVLGGYFLFKKETRNTSQFDEQRSQDLVYIYNSIAELLDNGQGIPDSLNKLDVDPEYKNDPVSNQLYTYTKLNESSYEICATFDSDTRENSSVKLIFPPDPEDISRVHPRGYHCTTFEYLPLENIGVEQSGPDSNF